MSPHGQPPTINSKAHKIFGKEVHSYLIKSNIKINEL